MYLIYAIYCVHNWEDNITGQHPAQTESMEEGKATIEASYI